jgi:hypothetical protein
MLSTTLREYLKTKLMSSVERRSGLDDYNTNPYVLMTSASLMENLADPARLADFIFNNKIYAGLETAFGKLVESAVIGHYPIGAPLRERWSEPAEKVVEFAEYKGLTRQEKSAARARSVWREIDASCVVGNRRYLTSIKSGPNTINDTQVQGMFDAIRRHHQEWMRKTQESFPDVTELDVFVGLTYGTDLNTNNKENKILANLLEAGFEEEMHPPAGAPAHAEEETPAGKPGVLIDSATRTIRVYRSIGQDFWAMIGNPADPESAGFVFLEVLLALSKALEESSGHLGMEDKVNAKIDQLTAALHRIRFPRGSLPNWVEDDFTEDQLLGVAIAMTAFFDTKA